MKALGKYTVAEVRNDESVYAAITEVTGLGRRTIRRRFSEAHGRTTIRNLFGDYWPATGEHLADLTVAFARDIGLHDEIQRLTKCSARLVAKRLNQSHGKTLLRNAFSDVWPEADEESALDDSDEGDAPSWQELDDLSERAGELGNVRNFTNEDDYRSDDEEGIESEDIGEITKPFDPNKIRVKLWTPTVDLVLKRLQEGEIDLAPDFQREAGIWKDKAQSQLIESLLIRIPLPAFYVDGSDEDCLIVVDGIQRLTAIKRFVLDKTLRLTGLEYLTDLQGKNVDELARPLRRRIEETMLTVYLIDKGTPEEAKLNIFKRLNTGGEPLKSQEIRHAMNPGPVRAFLRDLAALPSFKEATQGKFDDQRMTDRECALRFCAFVLTPPDQYPASDLDAFLHRSMKNISELDDETRGTLARRFDRAMRASKAVLGASAFRKPRGHRARRPPVNKALFEAWAVGFDARTDAELARLEQRSDLVLKRFEELVEENRDFETALSQGTGDAAKVRLRFREIDRLLREASE